MITAAQAWHERNAESLAAGLAWLRARLLGEQAEWVEPPDSALAILAERFHLSRFEQGLLLLCAAMELDPAWGALCAQAPGEPGRPFPTFALALRILPAPAWGALGPQAPLRAWRLIGVERAAGEPLVHAALVVDEPVVHFLKGMHAIDERLMPILLPPLDPVDSVSASQEPALAEVLRRAADGPQFHLQGDDAECLRFARAAAGRCGLPLLRIDAGLLPGDLDALESLVRLIHRELMLSPAALYVQGHGSERGGAFLRRLAAGFRTPTFLCGFRSGDLAADVHALDIERPAPREQAALWRSLLGDRGAGLAGAFDLGVDAIEQVAAGVGAQGDPWQACLAHAAPRFGRLAQRVIPKAGWDDLVLPAAQGAQLEQMAVEARHRRLVLDEWGFRDKTRRGLGLHALFTGESGTGKTLAAEVLARELRLHLVRVDLSSVVDKYIGETEKNLGRIFDAASLGGVVLLFDEADALFGKRTAVKDSHDRYANIEIDYLLQRMEAFEGIAILATNLRGSLDPAFLRRLRFVVSFPFPGEAERRAIWQRVFPRDTPCQGLDLDRLQRLNLTGGHIQSIALAAAFRAAAAGTPVTMALVLEAARAELVKLERPIHPADLG